MDTAADTPDSSRGLPFVAVLGLALLAAPRVVLHDLGLITEGSLVNGLLVFVPPVVWIAVVLLRRVPSPFLTLLWVGGCYGVLLALGHQLLMEQAFGGELPRLGGNLSALDPTVSALVVRAFAAVSSVFTGLMVGAVSGLVAWLLDRVLINRRVEPPVPTP